MYRKLSKLGAVKTDRNWSRSERNVGVSCTGGLLVARVPGCCATPRIPPGRKEVAIPHAYLAPGKVRNPNSGSAPEDPSPAAGANPATAARSGAHVAPGTHARSAPAGNARSSAIPAGHA